MSIARGEGVLERRAMAVAEPVEEQAVGTNAKLGFGG
jgi:hypothetical protein